MCVYVRVCVYACMRVCLSVYICTYIVEGSILPAVLRFFPPIVNIK